MSILYLVSDTHFSKMYSYLELKRQKENINPAIPSLQMALSLSDYAPVCNSIITKLLLNDLLA
jgi:hypothetical protein